MQEGLSISISDLVEGFEGSTICPNGAKSKNGLSKVVNDQQEPPLVFNPADFDESQPVEESEEELKKRELQSLNDTAKIDLFEKLSPAPDSMRIMHEGTPITLFSKGNFSIITGAAKSRKTYLVSMLLAAAVNGAFQNLFLCPNPGVAICFDTEQSRYKTQQIAKRIVKLTGIANPTNLIMYSLRTLDPDTRLELIDYVLANTPNVAFVAIDGIIDLSIDPILQADQAQKIVMKLMQWSENYQIHITCVLHYNKTIATLLGHLGSFSHRKADSIIQVAKSKDNSDISIVEPVDCREKEFSPFAFSINPEGMPYIMEGYVKQGRTREAKAAEPLVDNVPVSASSIDADQHMEILHYVFKKHKEHSYAELWRNIKLAVEETTGKKIGDNKAKDFGTYYVNEGDIVKVEMPKKKPVYTLAGQKVLDFQKPV